MAAARLIYVYMQIQVFLTIAYTYRTVLLPSFIWLYSISFGFNLFNEHIITRVDYKSI